jgi:MFS transporter, PPP family, 3-phenylpropionic acid transporter
MRPRDGAGTIQRAAPSTALPGFLVLYVALYSAYGTESAYLPAFLLSHGLPVERIGLVLAAGTMVRIASGTAIGRLADRLQRRKQVLTVTAALSGFIGWAYLVAFGFLPLLAVSIAHAAATASLAPLSDALSVAAASERPGFQYGWVRGVGSAAFVVGTLLSGELVDRFGLSCIIAASSVLFLAMAICAAQVRASREVADASGTAAGAFRLLWYVSAYRRLIFIVVLVIGSHAVNDTFAVISWRAGGYRSEAISLLWSESVVAEVATFFWLGPWLIRHMGLARCAGLSAAAGILRWSVMGTTIWMPALVGVQALHGLTFALLHMVAMRIIAISIPERLAATAQSFYGAFALGVASAALTLASGYLYGLLGIRAFWAMAGLCALALPLVGGLSPPSSNPKASQVRV